MSAHEENQDSVSALVADFQAWLEWQQFCGTEFWCVENMSVWDRLGKNRPKRVSLRKTASSRTLDSSAVQKPMRPMAKEPQRMHSHKKEKPPESPPESPPKAKEKRALSPWWEDILNSRTQSPTFDVSRVERGAQGIQQAFSFRQKHCAQKTCKWGAGRPDAPVVLVEAGETALAGKGLEMLSKMRTNVLKLPKEKLYWLPVNPVFSCNICDTLVSAQLSAIQPKAILIMGLRPLDVLSISDRNKALRGEEVRVQTNSTSIPAICTFHPMHLIENPQDKKVALDALFVFKRILQRQGIL